MSSRKKPRKWNPSDYSDTARLLRKAGFNVTLRSGRKADAHQKAAVRRLWNQNKSRVNAYTARDNNFIFKPYSGRQGKTSLKRVTSKGQQFPRGVFIQVPKGVDKRKVRVKVDGPRLTIESGKRRDTIIRLDPYKLARDPKKAVAEAIGKHKGKVSLMVKGFKGKDEYPLSVFLQYFADDLLPDLEDEDGEEMSAREIADAFSIRLIRSARRSNSKKSKRR